MVEVPDPFWGIRPGDDGNLLGPHWETINESTLKLHPDYLNGEMDYTFERELSKNSQNLRGWLAYLTLKRMASVEYRFVLYIRALQWLPSSYKLWKLFFSEVTTYLDSQNLPPSAAALETVETLYRRAIAHLPRVPRLRLMYCDFLWKRRKRITETRRAYDEALQAVPLTQHHLIWSGYMTFAFEVGLPELIVPILRRYVQIEPSQAELLAIYLASVERHDEAATVMSTLCSDEHFESMRGKSKEDLWIELCAYVAKHPTHIGSIDGAAIIRSGIRRYTDSGAILWCCLASFYAVMGSFDLCIGTYEEALAKSHTVEDFCHIFDSYASYLEAAVQRSISDFDSSSQNKSREEINYRMALLSLLIERRPEMISSVRIRRNPNNVYEWLNRVQLFCSRTRELSSRNEQQLGEEHTVKIEVNKADIADPAKVIQTFSEAVRTVDCMKAQGNIAYLWIEFAHFYELYDDLPNARRVLERGCEADHKTLETLVSVWCERVEMELRHENYGLALQLAREAVKRPSYSTIEETQETVSTQDSTMGGDFSFATLGGQLRPQARLFKSVRLWSLAADMEESLGTFDSFRAAYARMFDLKTITVEQVLIYAELLEKKKFFEDAFQVYEKGLHAFRWPHSLDIWLVYLSKFVSRYGMKKVDRARELFEEAVADVPRSCAFKLYFMYAKFEEHYGLIRQALAVYHRAASRVPDDEKLDVYLILIAATAEYFGVTKTRPIFAEAIQSVPDEHVLSIGLKYAELEQSLMELDRARGIYEHTSQYANPAKDKDFWAKWRAFEVSNGDEETFREMLRKKRAVATQFEEANSLNFDEDLLRELKERTEN